jgi:hypothetical protein
VRVHVLSRRGRRVPQRKGVHAAKGVGVFIAYLLLLILPFHYCDFLGMGKQSWSQILNDLWLYSIGALIPTVGVYFKHF